MVFIETRDGALAAVLVATLAVALTEALAGTRASPEAGELTAAPVEKFTAVQAGIVAAKASRMLVAMLLEA